MSIHYPLTMEELRKCHGVGEGKAQKFGAEFLDLIRMFVEEYEVDRPDDFVLRSNPDKKRSRVAQIMPLLDRKMDFEDIAAAVDLSMDELLSVIEGIVLTGKKLDLGYYIDAEVDEDDIADIYDYFRNEAESDSLDEAFRRLGADYDERDIRLVRLKFLCEVAN